jgi:hypothetical protein
VNNDSTLVFDNDTLSDCRRNWQLDAVEVSSEDEQRFARQDERFS